MLNAEKKMKEFLEKARRTGADIHLVEEFEEFSGWPMVAVPKVFEKKEQ